jgi:hypothetical protein
MAKYDPEDLTVLDKIQTALGLSEDEFLRFLTMVGRRDVIGERRRLKEEAQKHAADKTDKLIAYNQGRLESATAHVCELCVQIIHEGEPEIGSMGKYWHQGACPTKP